MSPQQAFELLQTHGHALLVDVRSGMEFHYVGHPVSAVHIPWQEPPEWERNPEFVKQVGTVLEQKTQENVRDWTILTICRSGQRSLEAARALYEAGYKKVYNISEGFEGNMDDKHHRGNINGWRFHGLPWEQS